MLNKNDKEQRQKIIYKLYLKGLSKTEIAETMGISVHTIIRDLLDFIPPCCVCGSKGVNTRFRSKWYCRQHLMEA